MVRYPRFLSRGRANLHRGAVASFLAAGLAAAFPGFGVKPVSADQLKPALACSIDPQPSSVSRGATFDPGGPAAARIADCFVPAEQAKQKYLRGNVTLVDVRHPSDFALYSIPGSLNIPLHLVKTKPFLRRSSIVLVNEGRSTAELEHACAGLRQAGFGQVAVLEGGLNGWRTAGGELAGDTTALGALNRITASEMFVERSYPDWLLLDFSDGKRTDIYPWLPARVERIKPAPGKSSGAMGAALARHRQVPGLQVVVIAETDADYVRLEPLVNRAGVKNAFYLAGGLQGYSDFLQKQIAMWNHKDQPVRLPSCRG